MDRETLTALASPPCHECEAPIYRVEIPWALQGDEWVPGQAVMVCRNDHRVPVELF